MTSQPNSRKPTMTLLPAIVMPPVDPATAKKIIEGRPMPVLTPIDSATLRADAASGTVPGANSIVEMARALRNDPQLMFEFVYDQIEFTATFGMQKGGFACLIEGFGNSFDQSALLIALLRQAGFTANYQLGQLQLTVAQCAQFLGITDGNINTANTMLANGGIPTEVIGEIVQFNHCWVQANVGTDEDPEWVVMDPSFKTYNTITGIDIGTTMGYDQATFLADGLFESTVTADSVENANYFGAIGQIQTYAQNLLSWIQTNQPDASIDDIISGKTIVPVVLPFTYLTSLPYEAPGDVPTTWTGDVPTAYKVTINVQYPGIDVTVTSDQIASQRFTWYYNTTTGFPELTLNGTVLATGDEMADFIQVTVTHNAYPTTFADQTVEMPVSGISGTPHYYVIGTVFGATGKNSVDYQNFLLGQVSLANADPSEPVMGTRLNYLYQAIMAEDTSIYNIVDAMTNTNSVMHHSVGMATYFANTAGFDIPGLANSISPNDASNTLVNNQFIVANMHGFTNEQLVLAQVTNGGAISATGSLKATAPEVTYKGTNANWTSTVLPALSGYSSSSMDDIGTFLAEDTVNNSVLISQTAWLVPAWVEFNLNSAGGLIESNLFGGENIEDINPWLWVPGPCCDCCEAPGANSPDGPGGSPGGLLFGPKKGSPSVANQSGAALYRQEGMILGSQQYPYSLSFETRYNSGARLADSSMGRGWRNSFEGYTQAPLSDLFRGLGYNNAQEAVATIAQIFVSLDMLSDLSRPPEKLMLAVLIQNWWTTQLSFNLARIRVPDGDLDFFQLVDGSFSPPRGNFDSYDGDVHITPDGIVTEFDGPVTELPVPTRGISEIVYPSGMTVTYNYDTSPPYNLLSVTNGLGRTLSFSYTGTHITGVSDGTGRSIAYEYDSNGNLTQFTDANGQNTVNEYDLPGRLTQSFLPQNPTNPIMVNTFDSLDRVASMLDPISNNVNFYLANSRSESVDPKGNSSVIYYNQYGDPITVIDQLGFVTQNIYNALGLLTQTTLPEGNSVSYVYDTFGNVLTKTQQPKPGSPLSNIVESYEYDPTWNKVTQYTDPLLNVTNLSYDPTFGVLLTITRPTVDGQVPQFVFTYDAFGRILSRTDETGIQTQLTYDTLTEELLSVVRNTNWVATVGGAVTVGDLLTLTAHDPALSGGEEAVSYTVVMGDTVSTIATGLAAAVNADSALSAVGIVAYFSGAVVSLGTAAGNATTWTETTPGTETITLAAGLNLTTLLGYDAVGNVNALTDPNGNETTAVFDNLRQLTQKTAPTPFSYVTNVGYDLNGNLTSIQRQTGGTPAWQTYTIAYTLSDQIQTITDPASNVTTKTYDNMDRLWTVEDAASRVTTFSYDARSNLYTVLDATSTISQTRLYSNNGLLASIEDANSNLTQYTRDGFDRPDKMIYADSSFEENQSYDANSNVLTYVTRSGNTIVNTFDVLNRLSTKTPTGQAVVTFGYDLHGRRLSESTPVVAGNPASGNFQFSYDTAGRPQQETTPDSKVTQYQLDANGNVTKLTYPDSYFVTRIYDQLNRLTDIKLNGASSSAVDIAYDQLSRRSVLTYGNGASSTYTFQLNNDLTALAEAFTGSSVTFTYGFNNVHQENSRNVSDANYLWHPATASTTTYAAANNVNEYPTVGGASYSYDGNANLTADGTWAYTYDTENHLLTAAATGTSASYVYDPSHRQVQKTVGSTKTRYIYAGWRRIADYDSTSGLLQNRYVYGAALDEPLIQVSSAGTLTYLHADRSGSIVATTDSTGTVTNKNTYSPFGENAPAGTSFGFTAQRFDSETGLYYYKMRYYSPMIGRFLQPDAIGYRDDMNLYAYVNNDPLNNNDPIGLRNVNLNITSDLVMNMRSNTTNLGDDAFVFVGHGGPDNNIIYDSNGTVQLNNPATYSTPQQIADKIEQLLTPNQTYVVLDTCDSARKTGKDRKGRSIAAQIAIELQMPVVGAYGEVVPGFNLQQGGPTDPSQPTDGWQVFGPDGNPIGGPTSFAAAAATAAGVGNLFH